MTPHLNAALAKAKLEFPQILANRRVKIPTKSGREISFTYAELEEIAEAVTPVLSANDLSLSSQMRYLENGKFVLATALRHGSGEFIESFFPLPESVGDAKELGIQISYGRRYNALCLLEISVVEPSNEQQWQEKKRKIAGELRQEVEQAPQLSAKPKRENGGLLEAVSGVAPVTPKPSTKQNDRVRAVCVQINYPMELAREWLAKFSLKSFDQLPLQAVDDYIKNICAAWASQNGMNEHHAKRSYEKRVVGQPDEIKAIASWMEYVSSINLDEKDLVEAPAS
ncbi:MAG: ERF family protein [Calothrix sp. FI2-JRJ7]|jgi:hypothetical protein|nr:ERF family protein [Calothrix sp. FI2-JRJ7]